MRFRVLAMIVLVVGAVPAATASAPSPADATALSDRDVSSVQETASEETTTNDSESDSSDYRNLYVESDYDYPDLKPGESTEFTVTVKNGEDSEVDLDPHVVVPPVGENLLNESWVTIEGDSTVAAGGEQEFSVTVSVPEDAEIGHYRGQIAFTDETVTYPGRPERPVHAASLSVRVWQEPTVEIVSSTYLRGQVEAGDSATKQIVIENTGEQAVPLSPQFGDERNRRYGGSSSKIDPAWVDIEAPSSIDPGETATVSVTVSPPEDAESMRYRGNLDLGLKDPNRADDRGYWQEISMNFEVWNQPEQAFETSFDVSEDAENVTLTLSPRTAMYGSSSDDPANFEVTFVKPDGTTVTAERVQVTDRGSVDLSETNNPDVEQQGEYGVRSGAQEFVYRIDDPEAGSWDLQVMPENVIGFGYEIVRNESAE
ncbi:COG1470 family protein [Halorussus marinus]|uniref:COG1470 family protein n=1 Tax=Halorussus marinus TaxID=2505976 RepID=UPI0010920DAD|nr:hypothetical protein [Halorussus marinus]